MSQTHGLKRKAESAELSESTGETTVSPSHSCDSGRPKRRAAIMAREVMENSIPLRRKQTRDTYIKKKNEKRLESNRLPDAVWDGDLNLVAKILQERNVIVKKTLNRPLLTAVKKNFTDIVKILCKFGADPEFKEVLNEAIKRRNIDIVKTLLKSGANPNSPYRGNYGGSSIHQITRTALIQKTWIESDVEGMIVLLKEYGMDMNQRNDWGRSVIFDVCSSRDIPLLNLIIKHGADVNDQARAEWNQRITMRDRKYKSFFSFKQSNPPTERCTHYTPLQQVSQYLDHYGTYVPALNLVKALLDNGADVHMKDSKGYTALMKCIKNSRSPIAVANLLLDAGSNPNDQALDGCSPLILALVYSRVNVNDLLAAGADGNSTWKEPCQNCTPLQSAIQNKFSDAVIENILKRTDHEHLNHRGGKNNDTALSLAVCNKMSVQLLKKMIHYGCDPNIHNHAQITPLGYAVQHSGNVEMARMLLEHGASPSKHDEDEPSPYFSPIGRPRDPMVLAANAGNLIHIRLLINSGGKMDCYLKEDLRRITPEAEQIIKCHLTKPKLLQDICRINIWRATKSMAEGVNQFPLPKLMKCYLMLTDIIHHSLTLREVNDLY